MRYVNIVLCLFMLLFIVVQLNDPDGLMWMAIYLVPAVWTAIAAFKRGWLTRAVPRALLLLCIAAGMAGTFYYWPRTSRWWSMEVWYETETAREGMGMMIVTLVLIVAWFSGYLGKRNLPDQ